MFTSIFRHKSVVGAAVGYLLTMCLSSAAVAADSILAVQQPKSPVQSQQMILTSPDFKQGTTLGNKYVANGFGCTGQGISPALQWQHVPQHAKSLVLTVYDPDAPTGSGFWHWNVYNLKPDSTGLSESAGNDPEKLPEPAIQLNNDAGQPGYFGACPPVGDKPHRYIFTLYALDSALELPKQVSPAVLGFSLNGKVLAKAQLIAYYGR